MTVKQSRKWLMLIYPETGLITQDIIDNLAKIGMPGFVSPLHTPGHDELTGDSLAESIALLHSPVALATADFSPKPHLHAYIEYAWPTTEAHIHALVATALDLPLDAIPLMQPCANELATWDSFTHAHQPDKQQFEYGNTCFRGYKPLHIDDGLPLRGIRRAFDAAIEKVSRMGFYTYGKDLVGSGYAWHHPNDIDWGMTSPEARAAYLGLQRRFEDVYDAYEGVGGAFRWTWREWGTLNNYRSGRVEAA